MLTWTELYTKAQRLSKDSNPDTLVQLKQDINTGYHLFNAKLARYYSRKQQFTDLIAGQQIYQTPIDCVRVLGMTTLVSSSFQPTIKEIRSEYQWRQITSVPYQSNWPAYYFMLGNDELSLWPIPSQDVVNGLRFYYQPQDHDLSVDDILSEQDTTAQVNNGSPSVLTGVGAFNAQMVGLSFQVTGITDLTWYEIVGTSPNTLTLKSAYAGNSAQGLDWRIGQTPIIPQEYHDAPIHYALSLFFSSVGNESRSKYHKDIYDTMVKDCLEDYSSSNESRVIDESDMYISPWMLPPLPNN